MKVEYVIIGILIVGVALIFVFHPPHHVDASRATVTLTGDLPVCYVATDDKLPGPVVPCERIGQYLTQTLKLRPGALVGVLDSHNRNERVGTVVYEQITQNAFQIAVPIDETHKEISRAER